MTLSEQMQDSRSLDRLLELKENYISKNVYYLSGRFTLPLKISQM